MNLLMLSSSRSGQESYLQSARSMILPHLQDQQSALFIPYAGVTLDWDNYTSMVQDALPELSITAIHQHSDASRAIENASAILVGGGNTFHLLNQLYVNNIIDLIRAKVSQGCPYVGWSAGSNICGKTICTTNDMPIIQPPSFDALGLVPFQLNPHYTDYQPPGHNGETRAQRIAEFCTLNPQMPVIGIREGSALLRKKNTLSLVGQHSAVQFIGQQMVEITPEQDLSNLL